MSSFYAQEKEYKTGSTTELRRMYDSQRSVTNFVIAPADAIDKEGADLILTGVPEDDCAAVNNALENLFQLDITFLENNVLSGSTKQNIKIPLIENIDPEILVGKYITIGSETKIIGSQDRVTNAVWVETEFSVAPIAGTPFIIKENNPVRVDFLGGTIDLGSGNISNNFANFRYYGNGVKIKSTNAGKAISLLACNNIVDGFNFSTNGVEVSRSIINNCHIDSVSGKMGFSGYYSKISNCSIKTVKNDGANTGTGFGCSGGYITAMIENCSIINVMNSVGFSMTFRGIIQNCEIENLYTEVSETFFSAVGYQYGMGMYVEIYNCKINNLKQSVASHLVIGFEISCNQGIIANNYIGTIDAEEYVEDTKYGTGFQIVSPLVISNNNIGSIKGKGVGFVIAYTNCDFHSNYFNSIEENGIGVVFFSCYYGKISNNFFYSMNDYAKGFVFVDGDALLINDNFITIETTGTETAMTGSINNSFITGNMIYFSEPTSIKIGITGSNITKKNNMEGANNYVA